MIFSWPRLVLFFIVVCLVAWLLYPNEYYLGLMHRREARQDVSISYYKDFLKRNPYHKGTSRALAQAYEDDARPRDAAAVLQDLYDHREGDKKIGMDLLKFYERAGDFKRLQDFRWEFYKDLSQKPNVDPHYIEYLLYTYYQYALIDQDDVAELKALNALSLIAKQPASYEWLLTRYYMVQRDYKTLLQVLQKILTRDSRDLTAWKSLIDVYRAQDKPKIALEMVGKALKIAPNNTSLLMRRVEIYVGQKQFKAAIPELRRLIKLEPNKFSHHRTLAYSLFHAGNVSEAILVYKRELKRDPSDQDTWWEIIHAYSDKKMHREAAEMLKEFLKRFPNDTRALDQLVYQYDELGKQ